MHGATGNLHSRLSSPALPEGQSRRNHGHPPRVLVTGFGPFPGVRVNPSAALARLVSGQGRWRRLGWQVFRHEFPTRYAIVAEEIARLAAGPAPDCVILLGVAARSKAMRIELLARNRVSRTLRDAGAGRPGSGIIAPGAVAMRPGRHAGKALVTVLRAAGAPAEPSLSAGRYVCNFAYWHMLAAMPRSTQVLFVHVPMPARAGIRKRDRRPSLVAMAKSLTALASLMPVMARRR